MLQLTGTVLLRHAGTPSIRPLQPLTNGPASKADRGYRLRTGQAPAARKAPDLDLNRDIGVPGAFQEIVAAGLGHLLANQPAAAAGDPEGVHQMRVAIRRLRTALAL